MNRQFTVERSETVGRNPTVHVITKFSTSMGRTRTKNKKLHSKATDSSANNVSEKNGPSVSVLLEKAQSLMVQCDYELALRFLRRVIEKDPKNIEAKEILGIALLETGEVEAAKDVCKDFKFPQCVGLMDSCRLSNLFYRLILMHPHCHRLLLICILHSSAKMIHD